MKIPGTLLIAAFLFSTVGGGQTLRCTEHETKSADYANPGIGETCVLGKFIFISTSYPDYAGRYVFSKYELYKKTSKGKRLAHNSEVFNDQQGKLVFTINQEIQHDFKEFSLDANTKACFTDLDSIPSYQMNDFEISFKGNEIWFQVHWGLGWACASVDGTIVTFKLKDIKKYLKQKIQD